MRTLKLISTGMFIMWTIWIWSLCVTSKTDAHIEVHEAPTVLWDQEQPELSWEEVAIRTEQYLQAHWFENYNEREVIGRLYKVKTPVLVCIAKADSSLGKNLKSSYNLGNVWNNDRWDVVHYNDWLEGINAIGKVLTNQYLGEYEEIRQLSRYGNKEWYIYASSENNWHMNVVKCLTTIYDRNINDSFNFRR